MDEPDLLRKFFLLFCGDHDSVITLPQPQPLGGNPCKQGSHFEYKCMRFTGTKLLEYVQKYKLTSMWAISSKCQEKLRTLSNCLNKSYGKWTILNLFEIFWFGLPDV